MESINYHIVQILSTINKSISNGLDLNETILCIAALADIAFIIWIFAWAIVKVSATFFETARELIRATESVLSYFFGGIKKVLKKLNEFGTPE